MKRIILCLLALSLLIVPLRAGDPAADTSAGSVVALINGKPITMAELQQPLIEAYGLKILLFQIQLNLAKQEAEKQKIVVTKANIDAELQRTLKAGFQDAPESDYPALLTQLLNKQGMSRAEFDMVIQTNAILRKVAEPAVEKQIVSVTDEKLLEIFNAVYGENAIVRHIACANPQEAALAKGRVAAGEKFEDVAKAMSRNARTATMGGELPAFTRQTASWINWGPVPQGFKDWAFSASPGALSDPIVDASGGYHVLKLEQRIAPKVVKFETVKEALRADLKAQAIEKGILELRGQLAAMARNSLKIENPILKKQYEARIEEQRELAKQQQQAQADTLKHKVTTQPTIRNVIEPPVTPKGTPGATNGAATSPANAPPGEQPPATKSAAPGAPDIKK